MRNSPLKRAYPDEVWTALELAAPYAAYLRGTDVRFDARATHEVLLTHHGIRAPMWRNYAPQVLGFCRDSRSGEALGRRSTLTSRMPARLTCEPVVNHL